MTAPWIALHIEAGDARDAVLAALFGAGALAIEERGSALVTQFPGQAQADEAAAAARAVAPGATIDLREAPTIDWTEHWRDRIHAHDLGALTVTPPWLAEGSDPRRTVIIDPGMAFGTGEHGTTRGVMRLLPGIVRPGDRVADLGAGSAVLAIAAVKLGAAWATAIELDPDAIGNAEENVRRNGVEKQVTVIEGDAGLLLPLVAPVRLVTANIISSVLVTLLPVIAAALTPDGQAILSGILQAERDDMLGVLEAGGWRVEAEDREDIWWSVAIAR